MTRKLFVIILFSIISCQYIAAQAISWKELTGTAWQYQAPQGLHLAGPIVVEFSDSMMTKSMFFRGSVSTLTMGQAEYYLADTDGSNFDKKKVGRKSDGKYLIYRNPDSGDVNSDLLFMEDGNTLRVTKGDCSVDRYTRLPADSLAAYKARKGVSANKIMGLVDALKNIKRVDLEVPGQFFWMMEDKKIDLKNAQGLSIHGPLRSADVFELRKMLSGEDAEYPKIKILDLSRAWIVTDTVSFDWVRMNYDHEQFMGIRGYHYNAKLSDFVFGQYIDELIDPETTVHAIRHGYGTTIELPAIPRSKNKDFHKPTYIKFLSTTADCIPEFMLEDMQNVEFLLLPQYTREIRYAAFRNCKKICHVTIPPYVQSVEENTFQGCAKNFSSENAVKPERPLHPAYADTVTNDSLREAFRVMRTLRHKVSELENMVHRQTSSDSIKAYRARREAALSQLQNKMVYYVLVQADPTVAPIILSTFSDDVGHELTHSLLYVAKDRIVFSTYCEWLWRQLRKRSDLHQLDPVYNNPQKMFHITTDQAGTLMTQLSDEEWEKITQLRITGPLNKKDLQWLSYIRAHLYSLDLSEAVIDEIPERAFAEFKLHYVALPKILHTIGDRAFSYCSNLNEVHFGDSLRQIGKVAFSYCDLQKVTLPSSLRKVGLNAFLHNTHLTEIEFPEGTDTLAIGVMARCLNLERVKIPASARFVGIGLIRDCPKAVVEVSPDNPNYTVTEGELVGKDDRVKIFLGQKASGKVKKDLDNLPNREPASKRVNYPMGGTIVKHYKMVNGKRVLVGEEVKK